MSRLLEYWPCVCVLVSGKGGSVLLSMRSRLLTPAPYDVCSIPWDSVVLPLGTPADDSCGGVHKGVPTNSCILAWTPWPQLGAVPQPRLLLPPRSLLQASPDNETVTALNWRDFSFSIRVGFLYRSYCCTVLWCKVKNRIQLLVTYGKM
jgi:hypothetical protein